MIDEKHFVKYQHVVKLFNLDPEVDGLLDGSVYIQPKIDGTNASMWYDNNGVHYGKRSQEMGQGDDNQDFKKICMNDQRYISFFDKHPDLLVYGEWLVKHTIGTYDVDAWKKFYVFDVCELREDGEIKRYLRPDEYIPMLQEFNIDFVPIMDVIKSPTEQDILDLADRNHFLLSDGTIGEGVVCKRYDYVNQYGRTTWGKYVRPTFKAEHYAVMSGNDSLTIEEKIVKDFLTKEFVDKEYAKMLEENDGKFEPFMIPKLLGVVEHEFISDEIWAIIKKYKSPTIDFAKLRRYIVAFTKKCRSW